jgi:uncharacterized iron-regulated protein
MKKLLYIFPLIFLLCVAAKSDKPAYRLFNAKGHSADYGDLLKAAKDADIILFGEVHSNPVCHWLELELTKDLYEVKKHNLVLAAEMFERDNQLLLNEYMAKLIRKKDFEAEAKLWKNYRTDYAPIVDFASEKGLKFIATNVPRRYAALVNAKGFEGLDSLNSLERALMATLPIKYNPDLPCYKKMREMMKDSPEHAGENISKAQALKDATMAQFILKNGYDPITVLHFNGSYHSDDHDGIVYYLNEINKKTAVTLKILTISTVEQDTLDDLSKENLGKGDFILCVPSGMTKTE